MTGLYVLVWIWIAVLIGGIVLLVQIRRRKIAWDLKLTLLAYVFVLILIARMAVNLYAPYDPAKESLADLNWLERGMDSFVHTFQSFSMDEDYTEYTSKGKELFSQVYGPGAALLYGVFISFLNIFAPIMGGAVLLEILTGAFPRLKLFFHPFRRKFVFSELNESSITLAEDLYRYNAASGDTRNREEGSQKNQEQEKKPRRKNYQEIIFWDRAYKRSWHLAPMIIFTDAYPDKESEARSELFDRAKAIGAVCLRTDLQHLPLRCSKSVYYFLMDEKEHKNVSSLAGFLDGDANGRLMWPKGEEKGETAQKEKIEEDRTKVFAFCQSDLSVVMIDQIFAASRNHDHLMVRPIRDYANAAVTLMYQVPLFLPLLNGGGTPIENPGGEKLQGNLRTQRDEKGRIGGVIPTKELHVTILGSGAVAEEVFQAAFWCGQIAGVQLYIHVLSKGTEQMRQRIMVRCPELLQTCRSGGGEGLKEEKPELLKIYPHTDSPLKNPPYAVVDGFAENIDVTRPEKYPKGIMEKTDYFVVALGDDERNIFVASMLKQELAKQALESGSERHPVIAPAVFDGRLAEAVKDTCPGDYDPYLIPFGMLEQRFSCRNVFMSDMTADALKGELLYNKKNNIKRQDDDYSYWANIVKPVHTPYKLFGLGLLTGLDLEKIGKDRYFGLAKIINPDDVVFAWMEKRRWNAYMRTQGFCHPTMEQYQRYFESLGQHRDLSRKLHNCLVEAGLRGKKMPEKITWEGTDLSLPIEDVSEYDALDLASIRKYRLNCLKKKEEETADGRQESEYKQWDGISYDPAAEEILEQWGSEQVPDKAS